MTSTQNLTRNPMAAREYNAAVDSLAHAEQLREILGQAQRDLADDCSGTNPYLDDAFRHAGTLVAEMSANLDDVMDRFSPDECGL